MELYHASRGGIKNEIRPISNSRCDFGRGFYMSEDINDSLRIVCNEKSPFMYKLKVDMSGLNVLVIDDKLDWAMLIAFYRGYMDDIKGTSIYSKYSQMADGYDVIVGYIADDRMYQVLTDFFEKRITDIALIESLSALDLGKQYVAITEEACRHINIIEEENLSGLELLILRDLSIKRREEGINLSREIMLKHRRDGRFFDEIISEGIV